MGKWIAMIVGVLTLISMAVGVYIYIDEKYATNNTVKVLRKKIVNDTIILKSQLEKDAVSTFEALRKDLNRKRQQDLRDRQVIIEKELKRSPDDTYLRVRQKEISREQKRLEEDLQ